MIELIKSLQDAPVGSENLDARVAEAIGSINHTPRGDQLASEANFPPPYTTNMQAAYELADRFAFGNVIACAWEPHAASVRVSQLKYIAKAASPSLALCIAALLMKAQHDNLQNGSSSGV
ncbi:hypothetical protein D3C71_1078460 [compost metagenome]